jgi:hypothetical protein
VSNSAHAATGTLEYQFGSGSMTLLNDPDSRRCINLPGTSQDDPAAYAPKNFTGETATVFLDSDCEGETYYVMTPGRQLGDRLKLRSVIFS